MIPGSALSHADEMLEVGGHGLLFDVFAIPVTLRRGALSNPAPNDNPKNYVPASWQKHETEVIDERGFSTIAIDRVWTIHLVDYVIGGRAVEPQANDVIETARGEQWRILRTDGKPAWELDSGGLHWEIRTKRVA